VWQQNMEKGDTSTVAKRRRRIENMEQRQGVPLTIIAMTRRR